VWFRRKPIWLRIPPPTLTSGFASSSTATTTVEVVSSDSDEALSDEDNNLINEDLLELHRRVFLHNAREAVKIVRKSGEKLTYEAGQIVLLTIPLKNRLSVEATRLPYRILTVVKGAYTLLSQYSPLKGRHQGSTLLAMKTQEDFGIPIAPLAKAKLITLPSAVTLANNRKSISAQ
jgi:hypothetical protein